MSLAAGGSGVALGPNPRLRAQRIGRLAYLAKRHTNRAKRRDAVAGLGVLRWIVLRESRVPKRILQPLRMERILLQSEGTHWVLPARGEWGGKPVGIHGLG